MVKALLPVGADISTDRLVGQAVELVTQVRRDFANRDNYYRDVDDVIYGRVKAKLPKGYQKIGKARNNPLAVHFVNTISAALTVDAPRTQFPHFGIGERAQQNSTLREHFFDASWQRQQNDAGVNIFRRFVRPLVSKGEACVKTVERTKSVWAAYADYSKALTDRMTSGDLRKLDSDSKDRLYHAKTEEYKQQKAPYPIKSIDVPPDQFYYWRGEDGMTLNMEHKRVPYLDTLVRYGLGLDREGKIVPYGMGESLPPEDWRGAMSGQSALSMSEIWTWDRCLVLVAGPDQASAASASGQATLARSVEHRYGDPYTKTLRGPYFHCLGTTTESRLPEHAGLGMLYGFLDLFKMLDELLSIQQINAIMTGLATYKRNASAAGGLPGDAPGEDGLPQQREPVTIEPGTVYPYDIGPVEQPRGGAALGETIGQVREFLEFILPKVLQGIVDTTDSGYQLAQAVRLGKIAFQPLVDNMKLCFARRVGFESYLIEECVGETVYAWGEPAKTGKRGAASAALLAIGPDDLNGVHNYNVLISPDATNEQLIDVRKHAEMVKDGFEDITDAQEALGQNPEEVERKKLLTETKNDPEIRAILKDRIKRKIGMADQQAQQNADQAAGKSGETAAPGAALGGMGQVFQPGQAGQPIEPTVPGGQIGLPASPAGAPGGIPPPVMQPPPMGASVAA